MHKQELMNHWFLKQNTLTDKTDRPLNSSHTKYCWTVTLQFILTNIFYILTLFNVLYRIQVYSRLDLDRFYWICSSSSIYYNWIDKWGQCSSQDHITSEYQRFPIYFDLNGNSWSWTALYMVKYVNYVDKLVVTYVSENM